MSASRLAGKAWSAYKDNMLVQDVVETAVATLGIAGAQALFSDMSPEEIAMSAGLGVGAAAIGRPVGDRAGRAIGRMADERYAGASKTWGNSLQEARDDIKKIGGQGLDDVMDAKLKHHFSEGRGAFEGTGSLYGRQYGDNIAQAAVGLAAPMVFGGEPDNGIDYSKPSQGGNLSPESQKIYQAVHRSLMAGGPETREPVRMAYSAGEFDHDPALKAHIADVMG